MADRDWTIGEAARLMEMFAPHSQGMNWGEALEPAIAAALRAAHARGKHDERIANMERVKLGDTSLALLGKTNPQAASEIAALRHEVAHLRPNREAVGAIAISADFQTGYARGMEEAAKLAFEFSANHREESAYVARSLASLIRAKAGGGK